MAVINCRYFSRSCYCCCCCCGPFFPRKLSVLRDVLFIHVVDRCELINELLSLVSLLNKQLYCADVINKCVVMFVWLVQEGATIDLFVLT